MSEDKLYSITEAMTYLSIASRSTLYLLVNSGQLQGHRLGEGGTLRFRKQDLDSVLVPTGPTLGGRPTREQLATRGVSRGIGGFMKRG
jgi:excisionase family DNA binding protein